MQKTHNRIAREEKLSPAGSPFLRPPPDSFLLIFYLETTEKKREIEGLLPVPRSELSFPVIVTAPRRSLRRARKHLRLKPSALVAVFKLH